MPLMGDPFSAGPTIHARETTIEPPASAHTAPHAPAYSGHGAVSSRAPIAVAHDHASDERETARPRRILYLDHTATLGGGEIALLNLVTHLDRERFEPIVALCSDGPLAAALRDSGIETHVLELAPSIVHTRKDTLGRSTLLRGKDAARLVGFVFRLARFMRQQRVELVHANSLKADIIGALAARLAGVPVLWHVRDRIENDYLPPKVVRVFRFLCGVLPHYVIANSNATMGTLTRRATANACTVYSGVDVDRYAGEADNVPPLWSRKHARVIHDGVPRAALEPVFAQRAPENVARPGGSPWYEAMGRGARIGLVGRISPWKGQHIFIRAAAMLRERYPYARYQIIGAALFQEQAYEQEVRDLVRDLGMADRVEFTGFRRDINDAIRELDILVHASTTGEPFGQVVAEGMAAGKPVVATAGGGVTEIVVNGVTGLLVPMGDVESMAAAIAYYMDNPDEAACMGMAGQRRARTHFSIEGAARTVEAVYDQMLATGSGPAVKPGAAAPATRNV